MLFAFLSPMTIFALGILGVLIFGRKMPELGRSLGQTIVQFKKGMRGLEDEIDGSFSSPSPAPTSAPQPLAPPQRVAATAPKFEDVPANPPQV